MLWYSKKDGPGRRGAARRPAEAGPRPRGEAPRSGGTGRNLREADDRESGATRPVAGGRIAPHVPAPTS